MNSALRLVALMFVYGQLLVPFMYQFIESRVSDVSDEAAAYWWLEGILMSAYYAPLVVVAILLYVFSGTYKQSNNASKEVLLLSLAITVSAVGTALFLIWWYWIQKT